ncbi:MAG TPA: hypothetical protein VEI97_07070, partial [bacterium]|nr:hypothetical protein [bacterium]
DVHARDFREAGFLGHRYRVPLETVKDSKLYSKARKDLQPSAHSPYNLEGDERVGVMGRGHRAGDEEFEDFVDLWEVYVPRKRLVLTLADEHVSGDCYEPLREQEWLGPDCGPYHILGLGVVPGNAMPKAPMQDLRDLAELANNLWRKLEAQARRQKEVLLVSRGADADGKRTVDASDGEAIGVDRPEATRAVSYGGPNQMNLAMFLQTKDLFSWLSGNLDILGGLGAQSPTATQDRMLDQNSSRAVSDMQDRVVTYTAGVVKALCWYWFHDPRKVMRTKYSPPGMPEVTTERRVTPEQRMQTRWADLDIGIHPYSMQHSTPQGRAAALNQMVQQVIIPLMPILAQQ